MATFASGLRTPFARYPSPSRRPPWSRRAPLAVAVIAAALLVGCGGAAPLATQVATSGPSPSSSPASRPPSSAPASPQPTGPPTAGPPTAVPVAPGAGALPQTRALPSTRSAAFSDAMQDLWLAVTTGNASLALPAFFPRAAYDQIKAIYDPGADWRYRLWYDFTLDVGAAHRLVDPDAHLLRVIVPDDDAVWVDPGVCTNSVGYWHVPGVRVVYRQHGQERSFGIASLISWRGVWYVVHLGALVRGVVTGIVDQPAVGPGVPGPAGGC